MSNKPNHRFQVPLNMPDMTPAALDLSDLIEALKREAEKDTGEDAPYQDSPAYRDEPTSADKPSNAGKSVNEIIFNLCGHHRPDKRTPKKALRAMSTPKLIAAFTALCKKEKRTTANALNWLMILAVENGRLDLQKRPAGNPWKWE